MTRRAALRACVTHVLSWPLPHPCEPQLDPRAHRYIRDLLRLRRGWTRWLVAVTWLGLGMATSGALLLWPLRRALSTPARVRSTA